MDAPKPVYNELYALVKDKDYFVLTTNADHCFQKAGFDKKRLFCTQGDYACLNAAAEHIPPEIAAQSILLPGDIGQTLEKLQKELRPCAE